ATMFRSGLYSNQEDTLPSDIKVAYFSETLSTSALDPEIRAAFLKKLNTLEKEGIEVSEISFDYLDYLVPCYYILTTAEASSNLSRYDGVRYGYRSPNATTLEQMYVMSRTEAFGHEVKKRIMLGSFVLSEAYFDAYYTKAQQVRQLIKSKIEVLFETYDYLLMPTSPAVAWPIDDRPADPLAGYMADIYTVLANLTGVPAISVPLGNNQDNLPFGMQIFGKIKNDRSLINFARKI
ncbi:MAG: amidase family protein, partial [Saprospiraceae bacterium]